MSGQRPALEEKEGTGQARTRAEPRAPGALGEGTARQAEAVCSGGAWASGGVGDIFVFEKEPFFFVCLFVLSTDKFWKEDTERHKREKRH